MPSADFEVKAELAEALGLLFEEKMGAVCSAGMAEGNAELRGKNTLGFSGKLKKEDSFINKKSETFSDSRSNSRGKKQKKQVADFSGELKSSSPAPKGAKQFIHRGSFLGRASEKAVDVLDSLGSGMPKLNTNSGFASGMTSRGKRISILAFEVANTITKGSILFQSLSEENIQFLKKEILQSKGVQQLVSTDMTELINLAAADKRDELCGFSREVARFGNMCKDPQWHNLDRYFSRLDLDHALGDMQSKEEAEKTMQEITSLAQQTSELYHELNAYDRFEQDYQQKIKEMESLNLPLKGEGITFFQSELKHQRKIVRSLKKKSLWSRNMEEIVEKLVDIVTYMHQTIHEFLGNNGTAAADNYSKGSQRLGEAGLALHYANIINQINMIASRPTALPPNTRDTLYHGLPNNIKSSLPSRLQSIDVTKELPITQIKAEMDKTLQCLLPFATNTIKAHQGFGWIGEWANTSGNDFGESTPAESSKLMRIQTLYYADKHKIDNYIVELLAWLHHLISFVRSRQNTLKQMPMRSPPKGRFQPKMLEFLSPDGSGDKTLGREVSEEDRRLLEEVITRRSRPGISKSMDFDAPKKRESRRDRYMAKSASSSPVKEFLGTGMGTRLGSEQQNYNVLDIMDGLGY
ncbi:protein PSK SIMULATOR 2 isoform X1 [Arachis hypogaea]|uniref:DUF668 domain-containing protein n=3 Tax=Arachis hypogaea TaxID=3818 RepID=A0A445BRE2_ARAHY|nr:uncharacterized protein LOC112705650 isoform X1 [Arachis hypogaea]RYR41255.1 hypothetical protein Ahy_A08g037660 isoform B [Arachis hypogaea]